MWRFHLGLETNVACRCLGRVGSKWGNAMRKTIMMMAMSMNLFLISFCIIAAMGMTTNPDRLKKTHWSYGQAYIPEAGVYTDIYLGVNMRYDEVDCGGPSVVNRSECMNVRAAVGYTLSHEHVMTRSLEWTDPGVCSARFEDVSAIPEDEADVLYRETADAKRSCEDCASIRYPELALILGIFVQLPSATTNCQRSTRFGDVNCQNFFGIVSNIFGLLTGLYSMRGWYTACYREMPEEVLSAEITWSLGAGFKLLIVATVCKALDLFAHCFVPTPDRSHLVESKITSLAGYMQLADMDVTKATSDLEVATHYGKAAE